MALLGAWLRLEARRRWRSLTVLALLVALSGGTVFAALAGARRGASAQERLNARTLPADAMVLANTPGFDWQPIRDLPYVAAMTTFVVDYNMTTPGVNGSGVSFPPADAEGLRTIERPLVIEGRSLNPDRPDEILATRQFMQNYHMALGDTVTLILATPDELATQTPSGPHGSYTGPRVTLHIVGVGETSSRWGVDQPGSPGGFMLSPALTEKYRPNIVGEAGSALPINALVRLRGGEADVARLREDIIALTGRSDIEVSDLVEQERQQQHHIAFESRCLVAFAVAAFIAALFLVGQAIARYAAASTEELRTLRALGLTPRQTIWLASASPATTGVAGAAAAVALAVVASRWLPYGTAGLIEPNPGTSWDWVVFGPGLALVVGLVVAGAAAASWSAVRSATRDEPTPRSAVANAVSRRGLPVPIVIGTRFALERGRGRAAVPVRPALAGAVMGVLGVVAAFTFSHGVTDAADHPERFGQTFQVGSFVGANSKNFAPADSVVSALTDQPQVEGVDDARTGVATAAGGHTSVSIWAYSTAPKPIPMVVLSGRAPETADEIVLGPRTLSDLDAQLGGMVALTGDRGHERTLRVVGIGLMPVGPHNGYADGAWVTQRGYDALFSGFKFHLILVTLTPSARTADAATTLAAALVKQNPDLRGLELGAPDPVAEVAVLKEVRRLPALLGIFLAVLAVGAVGHALATAVRRRSHDLAVLRALGLTQGQCRSVVVTQATVLALIGLLFGVPIGLAIGRTVWRLVADYTPVQYVAPIAATAMLLIWPAALLVANVMAAWPGRRAARLRISTVLRAE